MKAPDSEHLPASGARDFRAWWTLPVDAVARRLAVDPSRGLDAPEVEARRLRAGENHVPEAPRAPLAAVFFRQFRSPLVYLLLVAAVLAFLIDEHVDAGVVLGVLLVNAAIGTLQEGRAERAMEALREFARPRVRVRRAGCERELDAAELVPGDVLVLAAGDAIGADARVIESAGLEATESALTGESEPVHKHVEALVADTELAERRNLVFAGTHAAAGRGLALVFATGVATEFGRIAMLTTHAPRVTTPLERRMARFGRVLLVVALLVCASVVVVGHLRGLPSADVWMVAISQLVSVVPEGLPVALTVGLAVGMQRMAARRAIVRRLAAVEALGSTSVICSDKTGTLTRNEMTVAALHLPGGRTVEVTGAGYAPSGEFLEEGRVLDAAHDGALRALLEAAALCNDARIAPGSASDPRWTPIGDPTEAALVTAARKAGIDVDELRARHPRTGERPFESTARWMATEHANVRTIVKGAPEVVAAMCAGGGTEALAAAERFAAHALRVLAVAEAAAPLGQHAGRLRWLGLIGQIDPPRDEARAAIETCARAGVRAVMITGDHRGTASAVAERLGLARAGERVVEGAELERMTPEELAAAAGECRVFARVLPVHKLRLVESLRARGEVVAMTGDGVNDAPALVTADVGVAMGLTGTEVARQASDIVLTDDDFSTIVNAVEEGRLVHANLQKVVLLLLSTSLAEVLVLLAALLLGYPLPFAAVQILWNNVVTEGTITVNLTMDPRQGDEMERPPIPRDEPLLGRSVVPRLLAMSIVIAGLTLGWFALGLAHDRPFEEVRTGAFVLLAVCEWFNLLNCRSATKSAFEHGLGGNPWLLSGLLLSIALQGFVVYLPAANVLFHTTPLAVTELAAIVAVGSVVLWIEELRKLAARARRASAGRGARSALDRSKRQNA